MKASVAALVLLVSATSAALVLAQSSLPGTTGYINVNSQYNANVFYWFFESQNDPSTDPVVLWLTGGPGCSSELALLFENGPFSVNPDYSLSPNPWSWNKNATLVYVDQPVGTGFSYANEDYISSEAGVSVEMYAFLQGFFQKYPQLLSNGQEFFLIGESYAGHYVPAISSYIVDQNNNLQPGNIKIPLGGIGVGNGWTNPKVQYGAYAQYGFENQLIDKSVYSQLNGTYSKCADLLDAQEWDQAGDVCGSIMETVLQYAGNLNVYNIHLQCNPQPLCYNFSVETAFMNLPSTQQALGVASQGITWQTCDDQVNGLFEPDRYESFADDIPKVLASGARVLVYSGKLDLICNYVGGAAWTNALQWPGQAAFNSAKLADWTVNGQVAGQWKSAQQFTWLQVEGAGHMVPTDQPQNAFAMLETFLQNKPFSS